MKNTTANIYFITKLIIFILILTATTYCSGQGKPVKTRKKFTIAEIKRSFPYNTMKSVKLVSFKYTRPELDTRDQKAPIYQREIPKTNGVIDMTKMFEVKTLNSATEDKLLNILMNNYAEDENKIAFCYDPRNGIVFFDEDEKVIGYIEICFECLQYKAEPSSITVTELYPKEFDDLKEIFKEVGITYGTVLNQD